jgi:hypothetical protein
MIGRRAAKRKEPRPMVPAAALRRHLRGLAVLIAALLLVELAEGGLAALLAGLILLTLVFLELVHEDILHDWKRRRHHAAARSGKINQDQ